MSADPSDHIMVFVDLETTDLDTERCHILQLAAVSGDRQFDRYVSPRRNIDCGASRVNGLTTVAATGHGNDDDGVSLRSLLLRGRPVDAVPLKLALADFLGFLRSLRSAPAVDAAAAPPRPPLLLAAHNARDFDSVVLSRALTGCLLMEEFREAVGEAQGGGFVDTLLLSVKLHPGLTRYALGDLVGLFGLRSSFRDPHNALEDARVLQKLFCRMNPDRDQVERCTFRIAG